MFNETKGAVYSGDLQLPYQSRAKVQELSMKKYHTHTQKSVLSTWRSVPFDLKIGHFFEKKNIIMSESHMHNRGHTTFTQGAVCGYAC